MTCSGVTHGDVHNGREDGTGLDLSISCGIIYRHMGSIDFDNRPEGEVQVAIRLLKEIE